MFIAVRTCNKHAYKITSTLLCNHRTLMWDHRTSQSNNSNICTNIVQHAFDSSRKLTIMYTNDKKQTTQNTAMGFLVGPKHLITSYHNIKPLYEQQYHDKNLYIGDNLNDHTNQIVHTDHVKDLALIELNDQSNVFTQLQLQQIIQSNAYIDPFARPLTFKRYCGDFMSRFGVEFLSDHVTGSRVFTIRTCFGVNEIEHGNIGLTGITDSHKINKTQDYDNPLKCPTTVVISTNQTSCGYSGSALLDDNGFLVGMSFGGTRGGETGIGFAFAIARNEIIKFLQGYEAFQNEYNGLK